MITVANKDTFQKEVLEADEPVLVDFFATWCGPCQMLAPIMEELAADYRICKVDVDVEQDLARQYQVSAIPTIMVFNKGMCIDQAVGLQSKSDLVAMLKKAE